VATATRQAALRVLLDTERGGPTLADRLAASDVERLSARDRAFLHELVLGTLRRRAGLDFACARLLDGPFSRLDAPLKAILRLGAYQLLHLRVPARAAVSESVELARESAPRAPGLANAVLRRLAREGPPAFPDAATDPLGWMTTAGSLPRWLATRWIARLGPATAVARARALLDAPPTVFRLNPRVPDAQERARAEGLEPRPLTVPGAWIAEGRAPALSADGTVYLQDQGSQMAAHLAAEGTLLLDACAAPGGKTTLLADLLGARGHVVAAEASLPRLQRMAGLVERWGATSVWLVGADARRPPFGRLFDSVLLDAPCTGLGTLSRHPDIRWRTVERDVLRHAHRQQKLLESVATLVRPGGKLVYSVCSGEPEEGEQIVRAFLDVHPEFSLASLPGWAARFAEGGYASTRPERDGGDAFFAAVLHRAGGVAARPPDDRA
jgi:16S rRNA (cytosine967-C5)-methyltransferase